MSDTLIESYNQAEYYIDEFDNPIKIGQINKDVENLLDQHKVVWWCFITAWNPLSVELSLQENQKRNDQLKLDLSSYIILKGEGRDPNGNWQPERSFLVLGISRKDAVNLAVKYNQAAIIFGEKGMPAELLDTLLADDVSKKNKS